MPALPAVPGTIRLNFKGTQNNTPWQNTVYLNGFSSQPTSGDLTTLAGGAASAWASSFAALMPTHVSLVVTEAIDVSSNTGASGTDSTARVGTRVGTGIMSNGTAMAISEKVTMRWRGGHPRIYLPAPYASDTQTGRSLAAAFLPLLNTSADAFRVSLNALSIGGTALKLVAVRYYANHVLLTSPMVLTVVDMVVKSRLDTQRRRLGKELT
jgi:hypothetical protein